MIEIQGRKSNNVILPLWITLFCFTVVMSLLFQKLILPNVSSLHAGYGLMNNDAIYFHNVAVKMAANIQINGWSWENIWPSAAGARGQVTTLTILYTLFGTDPTLILPINAALHASAGLLLFLIMQLIKPGNTGRVAGVIAAVIFVILPSTLNWYAQIHKDGYAIAGTFLVLYSWLRFFDFHSSWQSIILFLIGNLIGALLILYVRPHNLIFLSLALLAWLIVSVTINKFKSSKPVQNSYFIFSLAAWLALLISAATLGASAALDANPYKNWDGSEAKEKPQICQKWHWQSNLWLPDSIEKYAKTAARSRAGLICANYDAASNIDKHHLPNNVTDIIAYLPRAITVSLLSPFPDMWFNPASISRLVGAIEIFIWYLLIPGVLIALRQNPSEKLILCLLFALTYLTIFGFTIGNLGTLHRIRYPFLILIMGIGTLGWTSYFIQKGWLEKSKYIFNQKNSHLSSLPLLDYQEKPKRQQAIGLSILVAGITLLGFIGFFYRDVLLAQLFGLNTELDSFFVAVLIPTTIAAIICLPLGAAFTPHFLSALEKENHKEVQKLISSLSIVSIVTLLFICLLIYFSAPHILYYVSPKNASESAMRIQQLTIFSLPILFFSGSIVIGNAILNALGKAVNTSLAQLVVPLLAIISLIIFGTRYGVEVVIIGMVLGQIINLLILQINIKRSGFSLYPVYHKKNNSALFELASQYTPLTASAFFGSITILVNTLLAMSLPEGGVSAFNLGNKIVMLATGLISAAISAVMLPYFSNLITKNRISTASNELTALLILITFVTIPISVLSFIWAKDIVDLIFKGGGFLNAEVNIVAKIMQYTVIQIPFVACNILLLKFATATKHVKAILLVTIVGLAINVLACLIFMKYMGVAGIALGASSSIIVSTILLVVILARFAYIGIYEATVISLNWLLFITLLVSIHFNSTPGVILTISTNVILLISFTKTYFKNTKIMQKASH